MFRRFCLRGLIAAVVMCAAVKGSPPEVAWGDPVDGVSVGLFFPKTEFSRNEPITAIVLIKNGSSEMLYLSDPARLIDVFLFAVAGSDGRTLPQRIVRPPGPTTGVACLTPGFSGAYEFNLRDFVEIKNPDELAVTATRLLSSARLVSSGNSVIRVTANLDSVPASDPFPEEVRKAIVVYPPFGKHFGGSNTPASTQTVESATNPENEENRLAPPTATNNSFAQNVAKRASAGASQTSSDVTKLKPESAPPLANTPSMSVNSMASGRKMGVTIIAALLALLLAILWRAARRKRA